MREKAKSKIGGSERENAKAARWNAAGTKIGDEKKSTPHTDLKLVTFDTSHALTSALKASAERNA